MVRNALPELTEVLQLSRIGAPQAPTLSTCEDLGQAVVKCLDNGLTMHQDGIVFTLRIVIYHEDRPGSSVGGFIGGAIGLVGKSEIRGGLESPIK